MGSHPTFPPGCLVVSCCNVLTFFFFRYVSQLFYVLDNSEFEYDTTIIWCILNINRLIYGLTVFLPVAISLTHSFVWSTSILQSCCDSCKSFIRPTRWHRTISIMLPCGTYDTPVHEEFPRCLVTELPHWRPSRFCDYAGTSLERASEFFQHHWFDLSLREFIWHYEPFPPLPPPSPPPLPPLPRLTLNEYFRSSNCTFCKNCSSIDQNLFVADHQ